MNSELPNLLIIGAMKCGTTSLHNYLNQHSDIFMSEIKELNFFSDEEKFHHYLDWYKQQFCTDKPVRGESSQNYSKCDGFKGVPARIASLIPDVKLIYIVRDPVARIVSHFIDLKTYEYIPPGKDINRTFDEHNLGKNPLIRTSMYWRQISAYLDYFSEDQILILTTEELKDNTRETLNKVFDFLKVPRQDIAEMPVLNKGSEKSYDNKLGNFVRKNYLGRFLSKAFPDGLKKSVKDSILFKNIIKGKVSDKKNVMSENVDKLIREYLKDDIAKFEAFAGRNFGWYKKNCFF